MPEMMSANHSLSIVVVMSATRPPQSLRPTLSPAARLRAKPGLVRCNSSLGGLEQSAELSYLRSIADCLQRRPECHLVGCEHRPPQAFLQGLYHPNGA